MELRKQMIEQLINAREKFEMEVEATALEVTEIAKHISRAIGDVSVDEAKDVIIREFTERLKKSRYHGVFSEKAKIKD